MGMNEDVRRRVVVTWRPPRRCIVRAGDLRVWCAHERGRPAVGQAIDVVWSLRMKRWERV